jgi:lipoprotein-anchoring transpeptidase ErfK/SrfK
MQPAINSIKLFTICLFPIAICSCSSLSSEGYTANSVDGTYYSSTQMASTISTSEKVIIVDPQIHAWGAYQGGSLVRSGTATSGASWCPDVGRPCRTSVGHFRIQSLGSPDCKSTRYPLPKGGAPMPYCMFFNGNQGLHGSNEVVARNVSHGCVRMHVGDAEWLRYNFANVGTKVIVKPY